MIKSLIAIPSVLLGPAAVSADNLIAGLAPGGGRWRVTWTGPKGTRWQVTAPFGGGDWSTATVLPDSEESDETVGLQTLPDGVLAWAVHGKDKIALRAGRRIPGVRPQFPGAGLVISRAAGGDWLDEAFADDPPDGEILAATVGVIVDDLLAAYLISDGRGGVVCRALHFSLASVRPVGSTWRKLPDYPLKPGVAAVIAGVHNGALIAAGGANFPDRPPWENGVKRTYDEVYVLPPGASAWQEAGRLPEPRAYAAVVSVPEGVLAMAGENAAGFFRDVLLLSWEGSKVVIKTAPSLPVALASPVAVVLGGKVYLAGGYEPGPPRVSTRVFFCLDLANLSAGWQALPAWPGPTRALATMAALDGAIYLISGLQMKAGGDGQTQLDYLTDAYRYRPGGAWEKLPDLPWSVVAAPSPSPVTTSPARVLVLGGVDGRQVGKAPRDKRVPEDILYFDVARHQWCLWPEIWPEPVVSSPPVPFGTEWIFISGEIMAGHRTTAVNGWSPVL